MADETFRSNGANSDQDQPRRPRGSRRPRRLAALAAAAGVVIAVAIIAQLSMTGHASGTPTASAVSQGRTMSPGPTASAPPPGDCASQTQPANVVYNGSPASSMTICPGRAPVGAVVHITLQGCNTPPQPPAALVFLGPSSYIGSGGAGNPVRFTTAAGGRATATFTIPATYTGGETGASPDPTMPVRPGDHFAFATYPAGMCDVSFTVTGG